MPHVVVLEYINTHGLCTQCAQWRRRKYATNTELQNSFVYTLYFWCSTLPSYCYTFITDLYM